MPEVDANHSEHSGMELMVDNSIHPSSNEDLHAAAAGDDYEEGEDQQLMRRTMHHGSSTSEQLPWATSAAAAMEQFQSLDVLDVVKESVAALRRSPARAMLLAAALSVPFSTAALSQAWAAPAAHRRIAAAIGGSTGLPPLLVTNISHGIFSHAFDLPFYVAFAVPSRATIAWTLALLYHGKDASVPPFSAHQALLIWIRTMVTYLWICFVMLACITAFLLVFTIANAVSSAAGFSSDVALLVLLVTSIPCSLLFAHLVIVSNLAITVSILERMQGPESMMKSILLLRGRTQVGLVLFIVSALCTASVDALFKYRVVGVPEYGYKIDLSSKLWEIPLLVAMHTFFNVFESISSTIFFFSCKASCFESIDQPPAPAPAASIDLEL